MTNVFYAYSSTICAHSLLCLVSCLVIVFISQWSTCTWIFVIAFGFVFYYHFQPVKGFRLKRFGSGKWLLLIFSHPYLNQFLSVWLRDKKRNVVLSTYDIWCSMYIFNYGRFWKFTYRVAPICKEGRCIKRKISSNEQTSLYRHDLR